MKPQKKTITKTKINIWRTRYFVEIYLHNTINQLQRHCKDKESVGLYCPKPYTIYPKIKIPLKLGEIHFAKEKLGVGYISHESLHCIFDWWDKTHIGIALENEEDQERVCLYQGHLVRKICIWLNENNLW